MITISRREFLKRTLCVTAVAAAPLAAQVTYDAIMLTQKSQKFLAEPPKRDYASAAQWKIFDQYREQAYRSMLRRENSRIFAESGASL